MSYRLAIVATYYPEFLRGYYQRNADILERGFQEQRQHLLDQAYAWAGHYSAAMRALGIDAQDFVANARSQEAWARETGVRESGRRLVLEQLARFKPDVVLCHDAVRFSGAWVEELRRRVPSVRLAVGFCSSATTATMLQGFACLDLVIGCTPGFVEQYRKQGLNSELLYHAFEPGILNRLGPRSTADAAGRVIFVGNIVLGQGQHERRLRLLEGLRRRGTEIDVYGRVARLSQMRLRSYQGAYLAGRVARYASSLFPKLAEVRPLARLMGIGEMPGQQRCSRTFIQSVHPPRFGLDMYALLAGGTLVLNNHIDCGGDSAGNMRLFESSGVGTCLLTDAKSDLAALFSEDEVVTYSSVQECASRARWLIDNPARCREIGQAAQRRTLEQHTVQCRVAELDQLLRARM